MLQSQMASPVIVPKFQRLDNSNAKWYFQSIENYLYKGSVTLLLEPDKVAQKRKLQTNSILILNCSKK